MSYASAGALGNGATFQPGEMQMVAGGERVIRRIGEGGPVTVSAVPGARIVPREAFAVG